MKWKRSVEPGRGGLEFVMAILMIIAGITVILVVKDLPGWWPW